MTPVPWLLIVVSMAFMQSIISTGEAVQEEFDGFGDDPPGGLDALFEILSVIWTVILLFAKFLVAPLEGAPVVLRAILGTFNVVILGWSLSTLIRGGPG